MSEFVTKSGRVLTDEEINALADEAEKGYDVSNQPGTLPEIWVAELVREGSASESKVMVRVLLVSREAADLALAGRWRVIRYVRADLA